MKRYICTLATLWVSLMSLYGVPDEGLYARLKSHVEYLASEELSGRKAGSVEGYIAGDYICEEFAALGLLPFERVDYLHPFSVSLHDGVFRNVVARIEGSTPNSYIVLGAHYDHLGVNRKGEVFPGADDNASGVAVLLEVARQIATSGYRPTHTLIFAAFDAEEIGLYGSKDLAERFPKGSVRAMVNMDMVGWLGNNGTLQVEGVGTLLGAEEKVATLGEQHNLAVEGRRFEWMPMVATDTDAFAKRGVPTLSLTTGLHKAYHKPDDEPQKIDYQGLEKIALFATDLLKTIDQSEEMASSGKRARKHRTGINCLEVGLTYAFGNTRLLYPESGEESGQMKAREVGISLLYSLRNVALRSGLHYADGGVTVPLDLMIKTAGRSCGFATVGGYWSHRTSTDGGDLVPLRHEWGVSWSLGGRFGDFSIEATNRYALTPTYVGAPHALRRTTFCTMGWWF